MGLQPTTHNVFFRQLIFLGILISIGIVIFSQLRFFLGSFLGAVTIYIISRDLLFKMTEGKLKWRSWLASLVLALGAAVIMVAIGFAIVRIIAPAIPDVSTSAMLAEFNSFVAKANDFLGIKISTESIFGSASSYITNIASELLSSTYSVVANVLMTLLLIFFMFLNAREMEKTMEKYMPFKGNVMTVVKKEAKAIIYSNAIGIPLIMFLQFLVSVPIFWLVGVGNPIFWAFITSLCGLIPVVGTAVVTIPMGIHLISTGHALAGIGLIVYGIVIISNTDNVSRIYLMKKYADTHPLNVVFGVIMGIPLFGFWGIVFGPLLLSMFLLLIKIYFMQYQLIKLDADDELKGEGDAGTSEANE